MFRTNKRMRNGISLALAVGGLVLAFTVLPATPAPALPSGCLECYMTDYYMICIRAEWWGYQRCYTFSGTDDLEWCFLFRPCIYA